MSILLVEFHDAEVDSVAVSGGGLEIKFRHLPVHKTVRGSAPQLWSCEALVCVSELESMMLRLDAPSAFAEPVAEGSVVDATGASLPPAPLMAGRRGRVSLSSSLFEIAGVGCVRLMLLRDVRFIESSPFGPQ